MYSENWVVKERLSKLRAFNDYINSTLIEVVEDWDLFFRKKRWASILVGIGFSARKETTRLVIQHCG